ncbi:MAG TPA: S53 family peptidase [Gemmata sp.]|nr:S53 family peptidase [Gemmata sp.]
MPFSWLRVFAQRLSRPVLRSHYSQYQQKQRHPSPRVEALETRDVPTAVFTPDYVVLSGTGSVSPLGTTGPTGYTPSEIRQAYGFNQISFNGTSGTGAGTTIAIVDAYSDPTIASDLHAFDQEFGLADPTLTVVNQTGGTTLPTANTDWAGEISLDVEWAHAIAPGAKILLVEATNSSETNLFAAVKYAAAQKGVVAVSMSWGGSEFSGETSYDSVFVPPASNPGVVFINSSGDSGAPASYPSTSPNVLSVGGTTLNLTSSGSYSSETAWSGSGGGISAYESQPSYQKGVVTQSTTKRTDPDVSYDANPDTGFPVYQTYGNSSSTPWLQYGGTSDAAPQWAALIAIADQGRALEGEAALSSTTLLKDIYSLPSSDFHDVTSGSSTGSPKESATAGYDLATGRGTPIANLVVAGLVGTPTNAVTHFSISAPTTATAGSSFSITVEALNASNQIVAGYAGTVSFTSSDGSAVLPPNYTFTTSDDGKHTFTVTLKTAGTETIAATDTSNSSITGTASISVSAPYFTVTGIPSSITAGTSESFTVTAYNANGSKNTSYDGAVVLTSSDPHAVFSSNPTITNGVGTFTVTFETAGTQSVTVAASSITGTESGITVLPGAVAKLVFLQEPSNTTIGTAISPTIAVEELDQYGNAVTTDSSTKITLSLGSNPGGATLGGTVAATVSKGIATFSNLSVSAAGTSYTLVASEGSLGVTSSSFSVTSSSSTVIENFQNGLNNYYYVGNSYPFVFTSTAAAHPGTATEGLVDEGDGNWYFRQDSGAVINPGDTVSVWVNFAGSANGRAYFGFGTTNNGLDSVVLAPNTNQLIIQNNAGFESFTNLAAVSQTYSANTWYLVQVQWGTSGNVIAKLYASNGTTLLNTVTAATGDTTVGTFAFRAIGSTTFFSTVTDTPGVNNFATLAASSSTSATISNGTVSSTGSTPSAQGGSGHLSTSFWMGFSFPATTKSESTSPAGNPWFEAIEQDLLATEGWFVRIG